MSRPINYFDEGCFKVDSARTEVYINHFDEGCFEVDSVRIHV